MLAFQSVERLVFPVALDAIEVGFWLIGGSLAVACGLVAMQNWVVRRTGSTAIAADRAHYLTDIGLNAAVLAALGVTQRTGWDRADPAFALAISGYMLWSAYAIAREALEQLLDRELPSEDRRRIKAAVRAAPASAIFMTCAPGFPAIARSLSITSKSIPGLTVDVGHAIGDATEVAVQSLLPGVVEAIAHVEPHGIADARLDDAVGAEAVDQDRDGWHAIVHASFRGHRHAMPAMGIIASASASTLRDQAIAPAVRKRISGPLRICAGRSRPAAIMKGDEMTPVCTEPAIDIASLDPSFFRHSVGVGSRPDRHAAHCR